jgi:hypothetical protein
MRGKKKTVLFSRLRRVSSAKPTHGTYPAASQHSKKPDARIGHSALVPPGPCCPQDHAIGDPASTDVFE